MVSGSDSESDALPPPRIGNVRFDERGLSRFPVICVVDFAGQAVDESFEE